jgi:cell shape-determining protein MreD
MAPSTLTIGIWARLGFVVLMTAVIQVGILDQLPVDGAHADAFLLLAVTLGMAAGSQHGAVLSFAVGIAADLFVLTPFGLSALCFVLIAFAVGAVDLLPGGFAPRLWRSFVAGTGGLIGMLLFAGLNALLDQPNMPISQIFVAALVVAVGNAILAVPASITVKWVLKTPAASREVAAVPGAGTR